MNIKHVDTETRSVASKLEQIGAVKLVLKR